jgi:hypothetical protein
MTERASYKAACVLAVFSKVDKRLSARSSNKNLESNRGVDLRVRE